MRAMIFDSVGGDRAAPAEAAPGALATLDRPEVPGIRVVLPWAGGAA